MPRETRGRPAIQPFPRPGYDPPPPSVIGRLMISQGETRFAEDKHQRVPSQQRPARRLFLLSRRRPDTSTVVSVYIHYETLWKHFLRQKQAHSPSVHFLYMLSLFLLSPHSDRSTPLCYDQQVNSQQLRLHWKDGLRDNTADKRFKMFSV